MCNKSIQIDGFMLYGPKVKNNGSYDIYAKLLNKRVMLTELETKSEVERNESKMFAVHFPETVTIRAMQLTTIQVQLRGPRTYYGDEDTNEVVTDKYTFSFLDSDLRTFNKKFPSTRQIPALIYSG